MRRPLVAGNWKMHGSREQLVDLVSGIRADFDPTSAAELMILPAFPYLGLAAEHLAGSAIQLGAQDVSVHAEGAFTGEVSAAMLRDCGCRAVLVGHSERRTLHGETDELVAAKFLAAQAAGLMPVLCVGETLQEREEDRTEAVVSRQLAVVIEKAGIASFARAVVAYEPVWAIGTGRTATPDQAQQVHALIRAQLSVQDATMGGQVRILYGGSVKPDNAAEIFARDDIDGGLIGGASLQADSFMAIFRAANLIS